MADGTRLGHTSDEELVEPITSWKGYLWDTFDLPQDQRWLLFKLDAFVLTFSSVIRIPRYFPQRERERKTLTH